jgi:hypothetical protein
MASRWLATDVAVFGRPALLWDEFYRTPTTASLLAEVRLQEQRFGLSPLDRARLGWSVAQDESGNARQSPAARSQRLAADDPRNLLMWPNPEPATATT